MRIAFVCGFAWEPKGTPRLRALPLAAELVDQGHEVTIFLTPYDNPSLSGREWVQDGVNVKNLKMSSSPLSYPGLLASLLRALNRYRPDIVHIFKPKGFAGAAGSYLLWRGRRRIAVDCDDWEGWGGWNDVKDYPWLVKEYIDRQERWMMRFAPVVTVASRGLQDRVNEIRGHPAGVYYIPNCGVSAGDLAAQDRARLRPLAEEREVLGLPEGLLIFYSGHFEPGDDIMFFCKAAAPVAERCRAAIVFVGEGPELPKAKEFFSRRPGLAVYFFPRLPYEQFLRVVRAADVAAFPYPDNALHRAKCSARIIDYMAMGKPVITTSVGQNNEYIVDGECGILAPPDNESAFAAKLELLLHNPELRRQLGRNAEKRVRETFRWSRGSLQQCLAAYYQLINT
jgi:glycosyltransferase involved in cell wall biosynthesis